MTCLFNSGNLSPNLVLSQFDMTWMIIRTLEVLGLANNVKLPTEKQKERLRFDTAAA